MDPFVREILEVFAPYATPIVVAVAGFFINRNLNRSQRRAERTRDLEAKLREDRLEIYRKIIEPYILALSKDEKFYEAQRYKPIRNRIKNMSKEAFAHEIVTSVEYREAGFRLALFGSDSVVRSFNSFVQFAAKNKDVGDLQETGKSIESLKVMGEFLLAIRKNVGNEKTNLKYHEMFAGFIHDIDSILEENELEPTKKDVRSRLRFLWCQICDKVTGGQQ